MININRIGSIVMLIGVFLLPVAIWPFWSAPIFVVKQFLVSFLVCLAFILLIISACWDNKNFSLPKNVSFWLSVSVLPLVFLVTALFSTTPLFSLFGIHYDFGTFISILYFAGLLLLTTFFINNKENIFKAYLVLLVSALVVGIYQIIQILFGGFSIFSLTLPVNLIGSWYSSGLFFGFISVLSLGLLEFLPFKRTNLFKISIIASLVLSLVLSLIVNFREMWLLLAIMSVVVFVYKLVLSRFTPTDDESGFVQKIITPSSVVFLVSVILFIFTKPGRLVADAMSWVHNFLGLSVFDVRPNFFVTLDIIKNSLSESPIVGTGPARFFSAWANYKPDEVVLSQFWNVDFNAGYGAIMSFVATTGILGLIAWIVFFGCLIWASVKVLWKTFDSEDSLTTTLSIVAVAGSLYLWMSAFVYPVESVILGLAFVFSGIIFSLVFLSDTDDNQVFVLPQEKKGKLVAISILAIVLIFSLFGFYKVVSKVWAGASFYRAVAMVRAGDIESGQVIIKKAADLNGSSDYYYRTSAHVGFLRLIDLLNQSVADETELADNFREIFDGVVADSQAAINIDPFNYVNYLALGQIYEALVPLGVQGSYESALDMYNKALELNPKNPDIVFSLARLEMAKGNSGNARNYLNQAINKKPNLTSALLVLAQIEANEGRLSGAIAKTEEAVASAPNDTGALMQLGFYRYQNRDYETAINVLGRVMALSPGGFNADALYFIGLSYDRLGNRSNALKAFEEILKYNPNNEEIKNIITNLKSGRGALAPSTQTESTVEEDTESN